MIIKTVNLNEIKMDNKMDCSVYVLMIHKMSNNKKVLRSIHDAESIENNDRNDWFIEGVFNDRKDLNEYYNEYYN